MSLKSWKEEFYPRAASKATGSDVEACEHSLKKWEGALPENLKKHKLYSINGEVCGERGVGFRFGSGTCALCQRDERVAADTREISCRCCPLYMVRGETTCYSEKKGEKVSPYMKFLDASDPNPMIRWLKKALEFSRKKETKSRAKVR